jgi:chromate transporter
MYANVVNVFLVFLRLGLTSFGGPVAHLGFFHEEFVKRKQWIDEATYADLVALCQFLPGPASSQVGMAVGLHRASYLGAVAAWVGFTLPSALILTLFGLGVSRFHFDEAWLHGLKIVAVAIVAQAVWAMARKLCPDIQRVVIAILAALVVSTVHFVAVQLCVILLGGVIGALFVRKHQEMPTAPDNTHVSRSVGIALLAIFFLLLICLPIFAQTSSSHSIKLFDSFYRAGSLVFGGGHVVLPLLQSEVVSSGWVSKELFMAGYGAAQAVPGPLFTFAAYLGAVSSVTPSGWAGAVICLLSIFLPSFLLVIGLMPFWQRVHRHQNIRYAMNGVNATVVGLLLSAFYNPVWSSAIFSLKDFALAAICFLLLFLWAVPQWIVVIVGAVASRVLL